MPQASTYGICPTKQGHCVLLTQFSPSHHNSALHLQAPISNSTCSTPGQKLHGDGGRVDNGSSITAEIIGFQKSSLQIRKESWNFFSGATSEDSIIYSSV